jgi:curved DNA-binding protein CbpA
MCLIRHMNRFQDHYAVLGVAPSAAPEVIRAAYRVLAQRHHPDRNSQTDGSAMVRLNQAYAVLSCPMRRAEFDLMQRRMHTHVQTHRFSNLTRQNTSSATRGPVVLTTYDHRGRLHAYA